VVYSRLGLEGDVRTKLESSCTGSQRTSRSEGRTLHSGVAKQPCRVIGQVEGLRLQIHVDLFKDRDVLGERHVKSVPLRAIDVVQVTNHSRSGIGDDNGRVCRDIRQLKRRRKEVDVRIARSSRTDMYLRLNRSRRPANEPDATVGSTVDGRSETASQQRWCATLVDEDAPQIPATDQIVQRTAVVQEHPVATEGQIVGSAHMERVADVIGAWYVVKTQVMKGKDRSSER